MGELFNIILPIITLVAGWFLSLVSTNFSFNKTKEIEKNKLIIEKIEELAGQIDSISKSYSNLWADILAKLSINREIEVGGDVLPFSRVKVLIDFYFQELKKPYDELIILKTEFGKMMMTVLSERDAKLRNQKFEELTILYHNLTTKCDEIIELSSKIPRKIFK